MDKKHCSGCEQNFYNGNNPYKVKDKRLMGFMMVVGIIFSIIMCIVSVIQNNIIWFAIGLFLGGGSIAFGSGGLSANKNDVNVADSEGDLE